MYFHDVLTSDALRKYFMARMTIIWVFKSYSKIIETQHTSNQDHRRSGTHSYMSICSHMQNRVSEPRNSDKYVHIYIYIYIYIYISTYTIIVKGGVRDVRFTYLFYWFNIFVLMYIVL